MLDEIKIHLRIDGDEEDGYIDTLAFAATSYMSNAGIEELYDNDLYKLAINILVSHWYENREPTGKADKLAYSLDSIMTQLKYCNSEVM